MKDDTFVVENCLNAHTQFLFSYGKCAIKFWFLIVFIYLFHVEFLIKTVVLTLDKMYVNIAIDIENPNLKLFIAVLELKKYVVTIKPQNNKLYDP